jgi:hypothetical protein
MSLDNNTMPFGILLDSAVEFVVAQNKRLTKRDVWNELGALIGKKASYVKNLCRTTPVKPRSVNWNTILEEFSVYLLIKTNWALGSKWLKDLLALDGRRPVNELYAKIIQKVREQIGDPSTGFRGTGISTNSWSQVQSFVIDNKNFVGRASEKQQILDTLREGASVFLICGEGGIGKTSLTYQITEHCRQEFADYVIWITAQHEVLVEGNIITLDPPLINYESILENVARETGHGIEAHFSASLERKVKEILKNWRCLIVLDNMDMEDRDKIQLTELIGQIRAILGNSQLLLTSRQKFATETFKKLDGLSKKDTFTLISLLLAKDVNLAENDRQAIYDKTAGNPLAIRLIVPLLQRLSAREALTFLEEVPKLEGRTGKSFTNFFDFVYKKSWYQLSQDAQDLIVCIVNNRQPNVAYSTKLLADNFVYEDKPQVRNRKFKAALEQLYEYSFLKLELKKVQGESQYSFHFITGLYIKQFTHL